jgi:ATP-binding cassette subfamily B protein
MRPTTLDPGQTITGNHLRSLANLLPYLWARGRPDLKARVVIAVLLLIAAKLANVSVPLFLRSAVDSLSPAPDLVLAIPIGLLIAYGCARVMALAFGELRDALFAKVAQHAIRSVALGAFKDLHALSLRFHLDRQTGGLSRALDRGAKSIEFLLFFVMFNVVPTILEILLVCAILWWLFDWRFAAIPLVTVIGYIVFTFGEVLRQRGPRGGALRRLPEAL